MNVTPTPIGTIYKVYITYRCVRLLRLPIESGIAPLKLLLYSNLGFGLGLGLGLGFGGEGKGVSSESSSSLDSGKALALGVRVRVCVGDMFRVGRGSGLRQGLRFK